MSLHYQQRGPQGLSPSSIRSSQVLREYLVVATRPHQNNGLGIQPDDALANLDELRRFFAALSMTSTLLNPPDSNDIVRKHQIRGKRDS